MNHTFHFPALRTDLGERLKAVFEKRFLILLSKQQNRVREAEAERGMQAIRFGRAHLPRDCVMIIKISSLDTFPRLPAYKLKTQLRG